MSVTITIVAETGPQAAREMANMLSELGKAHAEFSGGKPATSPAPKTTPAPEKAAEPEKTAAKAEEKEPAKEDKKPAKKKAKAGEDDGEPVEETLDGCRVMAKRVAGSDGKEGTAGGITKANKIIESFGVAKLSDIPEARFAEFIEECQKALDEAKEPAKESKPTARFD